MFIPLSKVSIDTMRPERLNAPGTLFVNYSAAKGSLKLAQGDAGKVWLRCATLFAKFRRVKFTRQERAAGDKDHCEQLDRFALSKGMKCARS